MSRPARRGEVVEIYATGLGRVTNPPALGEASPASPLSATVATPNVLIGGVAAEVMFSGLAPNLVGLYQINARISPLSQTGDFVPVTVRIGPEGRESNTVTIAVE
jgi:uncharacterized protein (TIGR03437 family)